MIQLRFFKDKETLWGVWRVHIRKDKTLGLYLYKELLRINTLLSIFAPRTFKKIIASWEKGVSTINYNYETVVEMGIYFQK